ncbi:hypothetical protein CWM52_07115 [Raoultella sp. T31]|nr:hypothetical protein CWM52_07115 [Raoultella sp. T31]
MLKHLAQLIQCKTFIPYYRSTSLILSEDGPVLFYLSNYQNFHYQSCLQKSNLMLKMLILALESGFGWLPEENWN